MAARVLQAAGFVAIGLALFFSLVWPTPWEYVSVSGSIRAPGEWDRRVSRLSGQHEVFVDGEWREVIYERADVIP